MPADTILVQLRLSRELVRTIDHLAIDQDEYRAAMFAKLLREALEVRRTKMQTEEDGHV